MVCLRTELPEVQAQLDKYAEILGSEDAAYYVLSENNGYDLDKAPNGEPSKLFSDLLSHYNGDEVQAIRTKARTFTESFKQSIELSENSEPSVGTVYRAIINPDSTERNIVRFGKIFDPQEQMTTEYFISKLRPFLPWDSNMDSLVRLFAGYNSQIRIVANEKLKGENAYMYYDPNTDQITVSIDAFNECSIQYNAISIMHEIVHALTSKSISRVEKGQASNIEVQLYNVINELYNKLKPMYEQYRSPNGQFKGIYYGFNDLHEFAACLMTDQDFFDKLVEDSQAQRGNFFQQVSKMLHDLWDIITNIITGERGNQFEQARDAIYDLMNFNIVNRLATDNDVYSQGLRNNANLLRAQTEFARKYNFDTKEELEDRLKTVRKNLQDGLDSRLKAIQRDPSVSYEAKEQVKYQLKQLGDNTLETFSVISQIVSELAPDVISVSQEVLDAYKGKTAALSDDRLVSLNKNYFGFYTKFVNDLYNSLANLDGYVEMIGPEAYNRLMRQLILCQNILNTCSDHLKRMQVENARRVMESRGIKAKSPTIHAYLEENTKETNYDISFIERILFSADNMQDEALKSLFSIVQEAENKVNHNTMSMARKLLDLLKKAGNNQKSLFEIDEKGRPTGYIVRDLLYGKMYRDYKEALKQIRLDLGIAETDLSLPENRELRIEYNKRKDKWLSDHVERKYTDEYYSYFRELSQEATDARESVMNRIRDLQNKYRGTDGIVAYERFSQQDYNTLRELYVEKRSLASIYRPDGTLKEEGSVERRIADELSALNEKLSKGLKMRSNKAKFEQLRKQKEQQYGADSKEYKLWYARNTRTVISEEFYDLLGQIERETYPDTNYAELQEQKRAILNIYRDTFTGEINADLIPRRTKTLLNKIDTQLANIRKKHKAQASKTGLKFKDIAKIVATDAYLRDRGEAIAKDASQPGELMAFDMINSRFDSQGNPYPRSYYSKIVPIDPKYISIEPSLEFGEMSDESVFYNKNYDRSNPEYYQPKRSLYDNSKAYNSVMNNAALRELRQGILDAMNESNGKLINRNNLNQYKLPQISGSTYRYIKSRGLLKGLRGSLLDSATTNDDTTGINKKVATSADGTTLDMIPQYFLKDLDDPATISADMVGSVIAYYRMAENFKQKSAVRAQCENIKTFLRQRKYTGSSNTVTGKIKSIFNYKNDPKEGSETNIYKMAEKFISMNIYDVQTNSYQIKLFNRDINLSKLALMLKKFGTTVNLGLNMFCAFTGWFTALHAHLSNIISGRYYNFDNAYHAFTDIVYDMFRHGINSIGNKNYSSEQMALMDYFEVGSTMDSLWRNSNRPRIVNMLQRHWAFGLYSFGDYAIKGQILNSVMYDYKNVDGEFISSEEFFRKNGRSQEAKNRWKKAKSFKASIKVVAGLPVAIDPKDQAAVDNAKFTIGNTAKYLAARADGQLTSLQKAQFTTNVLGSICMMHRNYIPALLQERLTMKRQWDYTSQREVEALIQTPLRLLAQVRQDHYTAKAFKNMFKEIFNSDDALTKANMRKLIFETAMVFGLYPFIASLLVAEADDDKDNILKNTFAYVMLRTSFETRSAYTLIDIYSTIKQPTPLYSLIDNFGTLVWSSILPVTSLAMPWLYNIDDVGKEITRGAYKGMTQFERSLWKMTPFKNVMELNDIPSKRRYYETQIMN